MTLLIDLTGEIFGRFTVLNRAGTYVAPSGGKSPTWLCHCDCGTETVVNGASLRRGLSRSCGCLRDDQMTVVGKANSKGDAVGYRAAHSRIRQSRGPASSHPCADCGTQAREWSYVGDCPRERTSPRGSAYSPDPERYVPRCNSCHRLHDLRKEAA